MKNILFAIDRDFLSNSAVHVHSLANCLSSSGLECIVAVPCNKDTVTQLGIIYYRPIEYGDISDLPMLYSNGKGPDIVHCWTPREAVRKFADRLKILHDFRLVIHLEDNEELLTKKFSTGQEVTDTWAHPIHYREFLNRADGVTVIIEELSDFVPSNKAWLTLWPGVDTNTFHPRPDNPELKRKLQIPLNSLVVVYTGNAHAANVTEMRSLYLAIAMLNREGIPTTLVRTGKDYIEYLGDYGKWVKPFTRELGYVDRSQIPELLALADVFIQPGKVDEFNKYRFPSKLPEFFAMGKPVILPATNIGCKLKNGQQALVLEKADAIGIVECVKRIRNSPELSEKLSDEAQKFAKEHFSWKKQSDKLLNFYQEISTLQK